MIFLSAGHYPSRPGACFGEFCEHAEAVNWVNMIGGNLDTNFVIVPTGTLRQKCTWINEYDTGGGASICVEVHFNAAMRDGQHIGEGAETLYMPGSELGAYLADTIQENLVAENLFRDRGIKEGWYRMSRLNGPDYFLLKTRYPAAIIEPEFIHHQADILTKRFEACGRIAAALIEAHEGLNNGRSEHREQALQEGHGDAGDLRSDRSSGDGPSGSDL